MRVHTKNFTGNDFISRIIRYTHSFRILSKSTSQMDMFGVTRFLGRATEKCEQFQIIESVFLYNIHVLGFVLLWPRDLRLLPVY